MEVDAICLQSGVDITKLLSQKKKLDAKRKRQEKKEAKRAKKQTERVETKSVSVFNTPARFIVSVCVDVERDRNMRSLFVVC